MPFTLRQGLRIAQRCTAIELFPAQLPAWFAAVVSAATSQSQPRIAHDDGWLAERALELVRTAVSCAVSCSFCGGMNFDGGEPRRLADAPDSG